MNAMDLFQINWEIGPRDPNVRPWDTAARKDCEARKMTTYAAMVDRMDQSIGRLIAALNSTTRRSSF